MEVVLFPPRPLRTADVHHLTEWTHVPYGVHTSNDLLRATYVGALHTFLHNIFQKAMRATPPPSCPSHLLRLASMLPIPDAVGVEDLQRLAIAPGTVLLQILEQVMGPMSPEELFLSKKVADAVRNHPQFPTLGEEDLFGRGFEEMLRYAISTAAENMPTGYLNACEVGSSRIAQKVYLKGLLGAEDAALLRYFATDATEAGAPPLMADLEATGKVEFRVWDLNTPAPPELDDLGLILAQVC